MNINKYLASKDYYLSKLNQYYTNNDLTDEKKKKIMDEIYKKINKLIYNINKKIFFTKNKYEKELTLYINYINYYTYAYKNHDNIIHFDFNKFFIKKQKIIHNIFFKYIYEEFTQDTKNLTNIDILNIIEYTATQEKFNIKEIIDNIKNEDSIKYKDITKFIDKYIPHHYIIIESIPVKNKNTNFISEIRRKFSNNNNETLYIFEDIHEKHSTNDKGKNKDNDYIRKYNFLGKNRIALSAGISTINESGNPVSREIIDRNIDEIKQLIIKHRYKKIKFLREKEQEKVLFHSKHEVITTDNNKKYIADRLFELKDFLFKYEKHSITKIHKHPTPKISPKNPEISNHINLLPIPIINHNDNLNKHSTTKTQNKVMFATSPKNPEISPKKTTDTTDTTDTTIEKPTKLSKKFQEKKITIIPSVYLKKNQMGDFSWEIKNNKRGKDTLYIFNDNHLDHKTNKEGGNNASIRIYNKYGKFKPVRSTGISTGWKSGTPFKIKDRVKWKEIVDKEFEEIKQLLQTGKYNNLVFSAASKEGAIIKDKNGNYILGTDIFASSIDDELTKYIPEKLNRDFKTVLVDTNKIIINSLLGNITLFNYDTNIMNINNYLLKNLIPDYQYYYNDIKKNINFFVNIIHNNNKDKYKISRRRHERNYNILKYLNDQFINNIHIPLLYDSIQLNHIKLYFSQYFDNNLFDFIVKQDKIQIFQVDIIINMIQQLLMATISYHTKTGLINTNINYKNIFYSFDNIIENNTFICYKLYDELYYINYNGYIWYLTDFSESIELPKNIDILLNKNYDSYHMYCEFKVIIEIIRNKFYKKDIRLDNYIDNISSIINDFKYNYIQKLSSNLKIQEFDKTLFHLLFNKMNILKTLPTNSRNKIYNNIEYEITSFKEHKYIGKIDI